MYRDGLERGRKMGSEILNEKKKIKPQPPWRWVSYKREKKSGLNEGVFQAA